MTTAAVVVVVGETVGMLRSEAEGQGRSLMVGTFFCVVYLSVCLSVSDLYLLSFLLLSGGGFSSEEA